MKYCSISTVIMFYSGHQRIAGIADKLGRLLFQEEIATAIAEPVAHASNPFTLTHVEIVSSESRADIPVYRPFRRDNDILRGVLLHAVVGSQQEPDGLALLKQTAILQLDP